MGKNIRDNIKIDRLVGEEVSPEIIQDLITDGRITFPFKPTTTSAVSTPEDQEDDTDIQKYLDSVADNEDMVKLLEDMRDDMLSDMKIPPVNDDISDAAKKLGSPDGTITKDIFDKAEMILNPQVFIPNQLGQAPHIGALTGNGVLTGDFLDCNEVTKSIADNWVITGNDESTNPSVDELHKQSAHQSIQKTKQKFNKKMTDMFRYILRMLWWNQLYPRIVNFNLGIIERVIGKPIDTPFLIFRFFKKLTKPNYFRYGPIHRIINKLRIYLLCKLPRNSWRDYDPDPEITVFFNNNFISIVDICNQTANENIVECPPGFSIPKDFESIEGGDVDGFPYEDAEDLQDKVKDEVNNAFGEGDIACMPTNFEGIFKEINIEGPGLSPKCAEAAKLVIDAVFDDSMKFAEYEGTDVQAEKALKDILSGNVKKAQERPK